MIESLAGDIGPVLRRMTRLTIGGRRNVNRALTDGVFAVVTGCARRVRHLTVIDFDLFPALRDVAIGARIARRQVIGRLAFSLRTLRAQTIVAINAGGRQAFEYRIEMTGFARRFGVCPRERKRRLGVIEVLVDDNGAGSRLLLSERVWSKLDNTQP
jgi:hypothetical protein